MTSTRDIAIRLARHAVRLPVEDRVLIVDALLFTGRIPEAGDRRQLNVERDTKIRAYRAEWHPNLGVNEAARQISNDIDTYRGGEWRAHVKLAIDPDGIDARRRALFRLLKLGRPLSFGSIKRSLVGSKLSISS